MRLTEREMLLIKRIVAEAEERKLSSSELAKLTDEFETYVYENDIRIMSDEDLLEYCDEFLTRCGHEELAGTFAVRQICDYIKLNYGQDE